jgi:hypothetical protein
MPLPDETVRLKVWIENLDKDIIDIPMENLLANESAGKRKSAKTKKENKYLRSQTLGEISNIIYPVNKSVKQKVFVKY